MPPAAPPTSNFMQTQLAVILALSPSPNPLSSQHYEMMSALDGNRSASAFQHQFRAVLREAKALRARMEDGEVFGGVESRGKRKAGAETDGSGVGAAKKRRTNAAAGAAKGKGSKKNASTNASANKGIYDEGVGHGADNANYGQEKFNSSCSSEGDDLQMDMIKMESADWVEDFL